MTAGREEKNSRRDSAALLGFREEGVDGRRGTSAVYADKAADGEPESAWGELIEVREDFEADPVFLVEGLRDGERVVGADVGAERVGAQSSSAAERAMVDQPSRRVWCEAWMTGIPFASRLS